MDTSIPDSSAKPRGAKARPRASRAGIAFFLSLILLVEVTLAYLVSWIDQARNTPRKPEAAKKPRRQDQANDSELWTPL